MTLHRDRIVIVSGLSGSGKSTALKILEDFGYFCVDNLPVILLPKFVELFLQSSGEITKVALVMDLREPEFLRQYPAVFKQIQELGYHLKIIFLEADPEVLLRRFNETRRKHPLAMEDEPLRESIERERGQLQELKQWARIVIDTSNDTVHDLKRKISDLFRVEEKRSLLISLLSFGFSNGIPTEADLVFDV
ncbi:MAG: RNase adaptor protein RapZ, partial [Deltaproteobacteria bacterium]